MSRTKTINAFPLQKSKRKGRKLSSALNRIQQRSLEVTADDLHLYEPRDIDCEMVQAMLGGAINFKEIAEIINRAETTVSNALRDAVACAWIAKKVNALVHTRIGLVDAAILRKALSGDVRAAECIYKRFGAMVNKSIVLTGDLGDLSRFTDADLEAITASELKRHPDLTGALSPSDRSPTPPEEPSET